MDDGRDPFMDQCVEQLLEEGWWTDDKAKSVTQAVVDIISTQIYENGKKSDGISVEFLMRMAILEDEIGLESKFQPQVDEARAYFAEKERIAASNARDVTPDSATS